MRRCCKITSSVIALAIIGMFAALSLYTFFPPLFQSLQASTKKPTVDFEQYVQSLYETIELKKSGLDLDCFRYALIGYFNLREKDAIKKAGIISIIDFRKPCNERRFYTIDIAGRKVLYHTFVAHGRNSGDIYARRFSNRPGSLRSSLGFFVTGTTYHGEYGYSLYLYGMEQGFNDKAKARRIVVHGAYYVGSPMIQQYGKIGQTFGCPALPAGPHITIIDTIKGGTCLFQFYDDKNYVAQSSLFDVAGATAQFTAERLPVAQGKAPAR